MTKPKSAAEKAKSGKAKKPAAKDSASAAKAKARAKTAQTDPESIGIAGSKQQQALYRGGSLAQRRGGEGELGDAQSVSGNEVTSASPPNVKEEGRVSSPMFDEVPVTGKGRTPAESGSNSRRSASAHRAASLPLDIDNMEPGTSIEKFGGTNPEVRIRTTIAGGAVRIFAGATFAAALEDLHKFLRGEALLLPTASDQEKKAAADANEANVRAMKGKSTVEGEDGKAAAKRAAAKSRSPGS